MSTNNLNILFIAILSGSVATVAFDLFGQSLSPLLGLPKLAPVGLAKGVLKAVFGAGPTPVAHMLHIFTGVLGYSIGWLLIVRPLGKKLLPSLPEMFLAVAYGVALWVFGLFILAHFVAGMPAFLGFSTITWVALFGHILFAVVLAFVANRCETSQNQ